MLCQSNARVLFADYRGLHFRKDKWRLKQRRFLASCRNLSAWENSMKLVIDNTSPIDKWLWHRSWETMTNAEKASLQRRLDIDHAIKQVVRFGSSKGWTYPLKPSLARVACLLTGAFLCPQLSFIWIPIDKNIHKMNNTCKCISCGFRYGYSEQN